MAVQYLMGVSDIRGKAAEVLPCDYSLHSCLRYKKSSSGFRTPVSDIAECPIIDIGLYFRSRP